MFGMAPRSVMAPVAPSIADRHAWLAVSVGEDDSVIDHRPRSPRPRPTRVGDSLAHAGLTVNGPKSVFIKVEGVQRGRN